MKKIMVIILLLLFLCIGFTSATNNTLQVQDNYLINDTYQLESKIPINQSISKYRVSSFIDGRNMEKADSGGLCLDCDTNEYIYILPHDLGLGHHKLTFIIEDESNNLVTRQSYDFDIVKDNEETAMYDIITPYRYLNLNNIDNEAYLTMVNNDYNEIQQLYLYGEETTAEENTQLINVNLGKLIAATSDNGLTMTNE